MTHVAIAELRKREKAHTREGDAIAAARLRLPMVEVDVSAKLTGVSAEVTLLDAFEGRPQLFASYHTWHTGRPAAGQCEGCTFNSGHVLELGCLHSRGVTYAVLCGGPFEESNRYRGFMGWEMRGPRSPHNPPPERAARYFGMKCCYQRDGDRVFETYRATARGCEPMGSFYGMLDMTVYGRQETWGESPDGWPQGFSPGTRTA